ncbi:MAG: hypothetical protein IT232_10340 [Flavobacteriales bacterium]|nr:hypothetical protein [Flavobacteriales bacterium]
MKSKLLSIKKKSNFNRIDKDALSKLVGGSNTAGTSCGQTGSTCGCDKTCVCNCPPPPNG